MTAASALDTLTVPARNGDAAPAAPGISLDAHRAAFASRRFLAMPLAGTLAWIVVGVGGATLSTYWASMLLYAATGAIAYMGIALSHLTGERFLDKTRPANPFDRLFFAGVAQALLVYAVAIPFALKEPTALPLGVGVLAGLMWLPFSWIVQHWIGAAHAIGRTLLLVAGHYAFPDHRFVVIPALVVLCYALTIPVLELRWRRLGRPIG